MACMCGDSECPSCGLAQGTYNPEYELVEDWIAATFPNLPDYEIDILMGWLGDARLDNLRGWIVQAAERWKAAGAPRCKPFEPGVVRYDGAPIEFFDLPAPPNSNDPE